MSLSGGVTFEPYLAGDRQSLDIKTGSWHGLTLASTRGQMLAAYLNAIQDVICQTIRRAGVLSAASYLPEACAELFLIMETAGPEKARAYYEQLKSLAAQTGGRAPRHIWPIETKFILIPLSCCELTVPCF